MNKKYGKILVVDDDDDILLAARLLLKKHYALVHTEKDPNSIPTRLKNEDYDVILLDMNFAKGASSGEEGFYWLNKITELDPAVVVVLITAYGDVELAVRAIKEGAMDFVLKPWQNEKLLATISAAMNLRKSKVEVDNLRSRQKQLNADLAYRFQDFIGESEAMQRVFATIHKVAKTDANVLITGENGTGKELVARELHRQSPRADEVFISVDMGAISETLFESELFGHVKGAFTDAREDRAGRFEIASGGTLFLDEIGNLPLPLQAKLLTVLENRQVTRLGSNVPKQIDVRLICATNKPIHEMVVETKFRQDLLYRINTVEIPLPPLRERKEDIPLLLDHFLTRYCKKYQKPNKRISASALKKLQKYYWPGNVRELQHAVERAVIMSDSNVLQPFDFFFTTAEQKEDGLIFDNYNLEEVEKIVIQKAISKHDGNISKAARELGLTRTSLYRRLEKYGL
ncbi:sigma-54-dependent Fis family transcriptional regulator [candidate division KSB1 bacterium]|nr:sigma-54-dependent Fis family transcriptional regulator [candidate division KSB1 bacterium]NIR70326.1 sigma-54-dependent Fis family transcriptional regulator [candidate division KSB1 bacterium]NIS27630.1 sigma-54-dependent Fis family transcriptional regulator [candidate division KSB1 bacterium]NIT74470.1 sigma-54-dependent Fis family transcriptional regulator [candidate division KSB1 bacterium]NIU28995.1 sigma-54-dependent Fis family transcriptional regulator [candidate division KSB1 bacteri